MTYYYKGELIDNIVNNGGSTSTEYGNGFPLRSNNAITSYRKVDATFGYSGSGWNQSYFQTPYWDATSTTTWTVPPWTNHLPLHQKAGGGGGGGGGGGWYYLKDGQNLSAGGEPGTAGVAGGSNQVNKFAINNSTVYAAIGGGGAGGNGGNADGINRNYSPQASAGNVGQNGQVGTQTYIRYNGNDYAKSHGGSAGSGGYAGSGANVYKDELYWRGNGQHDKFDRTGSIPSNTTGVDQGNYGKGGDGGKGAVGGNNSGFNGGRSTGEKAQNGSAGKARIFLLHG